MSESFICRRGGSGGSGATLVITGVAGDTCTISKSGKSKSKTFGSDGKATFKGLETGTWTVTMTNSSGSTATRTVTINADYTLTIAYFSATISVTYPAGSTCTCVNGSTTLTAVGTTGSYTFTVGNTGTWMVSCTDGTDTASESVSITADGQSKSVTLTYSFYLIKNGVKQVDFVENKYSSTITWGGQSGYALFSGDSAQVYTTTAIDTAKYSTLHVKVKSNADTGTYNTTTIGVRSTTPTGNSASAAQSVPNIASKNLTLTANITANESLDITSVGGNYHICFLYHLSNRYLYDIWLS